MAIDGGLAALFRKNLPEVHFQRVESGLTGLGIPDLNYCYRGIEGWIENKRTAGWKVTMRPEQIGWIERRTRAGGRVFIAVRRDEDELWLLKGCAARHLIEPGALKRLPPRTLVGRWDGGPGRWPWASITKLLVAKSMA